MSSVTRTSGVAGSFPVTFTQAPTAAPTLTIYSDLARTVQAVASAALVATANETVWTAAYPASLAAGTYYLKFSAVYTVGQPATLDQDDTLVLLDPDVSVGDRDYCTLAQLKSSLGITDTVDDVALERAVTAASRAVDEHCGRRFWQDAAAQTRVFPSDDRTVLWVDDISDDATLTVAVDEDGDGTYETSWAASDFVAGPANALADDRPLWKLTALNGDQWPLGDGRPVVQVTARFGWPTVPAEVETATIIKAARLFRRKDTPEGVAGGGEFGVVRISRFEDPDVDLLLRPFRKLRGIG